MGLPSAALNAQLQLLEWSKTRIGSLYLERLVEPMDFSFARMTRRMIDACETFAVEENMAELIDQASHTIPSYTLHDDDLPCPGGFIYLPHNTVIMDDKGKPLAIRALSYYRFSFTEDVADEHRTATGHITYNVEDPATGIFMILFTDPRDKRDHMHDVYMREFATHGGPTLFPMVGGTWEFGRELQNEERPVNRWLMSFFRLVSETYVEQRMVLPDRAARRRVAAIGRPEPRIRIVQLRRREPRSRTASEEPPEEQMWSHRWIVRGHWRNQWYPSQARHAPKWVHEYIKGPDNRPLVINDRIFHVAR